MLCVRVKCSKELSSTINGKKLYLFLLQLIKKEVAAETVFFYTTQSAEEGISKQHMSTTPLCRANSRPSQGSSINRTLLGFLLLKDDIIGTGSFRSWLLCSCKFCITLLQIFEYYSVPCRGLALGFYHLRCFKNHLSLMIMQC